jgi:fibronectin type 3 domain-containing protein
VQLNWGGVADADNYKVYRASCSGCGLTYLGTSNNGTYTDYSTGAGTAYYYKVSALVGSTEGYVGNEAAGWGQYPAPSQVTDLSATQGTLYGKVNLSWSATSNATNYDIYWTGGYLTNVSGTFYTHDTYNDAHYNYVVVAKGPGGSAASSNNAVGWGKLPAPVNTLTASQGLYHNTVQLSWSGVADANYYKIYRAPWSGGPLTMLATTTNWTYNDWQAVSDTHYYYKVSAVVGSLEGPTGNEATGWQLIPPDQVTGVSATQGTLYGKIRITWPASPRASSYDLYRSTSSGTKGSRIGSDLSGTSFDNTSVAGTTGYYYTVVAKNAAGSAPDSAQALGWGKVPAPVNTLTATEGTKNAKVTLSWASDPDAIGYEVWRSTSSGGAATKIATLPAPSSGMDDTTVSGVSSHYYKVYALVGPMISAAGNEAEGWANAAPTSATVTMTATSTTPSDATSPTVVDPNVTAGKPESYTIAITTQPATGTLTLQSNNFVYTPPADGLFSGDLTFAFTVTDKGGLTITGAGVISVICPSPSIESFTLTKSNILQASQFQSSATFSVPACSTSSSVWVDVIDSNSAVVVGGIPISTVNGSNLTQAFTSKGPVDPGSYTVRLTADNHSGITTKTESLTVTAVNLPTLSILPGLNVVAGQDIVMASLSKPGNANCPLTKDPAVATADPSKCYVMFATPPPAMTISTAGTLPILMGPVETDGSFPITAEVHKFDGTDLVKVGEVSQTVIAACNAPVISALDIPSLLPYEQPSYGATYKAFACSDSLSGMLTIKQGGNIIDTINLASLSYGAEAKATMIGTGLPEGTYTAELNISSAFGTDSKSQVFDVKPTPMPTLLVSPALGIGG